MRTTIDGYKIPETQEEQIEAVEHNTHLAAERDAKKTPEEKQNDWKYSHNNPGNTEMYRQIKAKELLISKLTITDYKSNIELFYQDQPFFYDKNKIYWLWNLKKKIYEMVDETDILNRIDKELKLNGLTVNQKIKNAYVEAFKQVGRNHIPDAQPENTIQIGWDVVNIKNNTITQATPAYFYCNAIPHVIGDSEDTPVIDRLFQEWAGESQKNALYEILAYCMHQKTPIQILIALVGTGRNGKSKFIELLCKYLGNENVTTSDLNRLLNNRFEAAKTYKKLACIIGETNYDIISQTAVLKQMTGDSRIGFEYKNKNPFDDYFYTKIIMASNGLPNTKDMSEGYMRRWLILNFNNEFPEGKDVLEQIPSVEYSNLSRKLVRILKELLDRGSFTGQGTIDERRAKYILNSNPIIPFLQEYCEPTDTGFIKAGDLYHHFINFLRKHKKRLLKRKDFNQLLAEEGYGPEHTKKYVGEEWVNSYWVLGLKFKDYVNTLNSGISPTFHISSHIYSSYIETTGKIGDLGNEYNKSDEISQIYSILLDKPNQQDFIINLESLGFNKDLINNLIIKGDLIEINPGVVRLN